jgi:hypothetical protein
MQTMSLSVNLRFGLSFENGYLLITVVRVERNLRASREAGQAGRDVLGADLFSDEGNGLNAIAALDYRQRIDSQNVCFCHGKYLLMKSAALVVNLTAGLSVRQGRQSSRLAVMRNANRPRQ